MTASDQGKRPRGMKRSPVDVSLDVTKTQQMLASGRTKAEIVRHFAARAVAPLSERTVRRLVASARRLWAEERAESRGSDVEATIHRLTYLSRLWQKRSPAAAARAEALLADVRGVRQPERVELHGKVAVAHVHVDLAKLDDADLEALERLAERVPLALPALESEKAANG